MPFSWVRRIAGIQQHTRCWANPIVSTRGLFELGGSSLLLALLAASGHAQVVPDATLPTPSLVDSSDLGQTLTVGGGSLAGSNLFHSFQEFSIPAATAVELLAPEGLADTSALSNIFLRVTGDRLSQIDGQLSAPGTADIFLLNPNGIEFGGEARLTVGGMFFASTADRVDFADGTSWLTGGAAFDTPTILSVSVPTGLQFNTRSGDTTGGNITVLGEGQRELLAGDDGSEPLLEQIRTANANVDVDSLSSLFATVGIAGEGLEVSAGEAIVLVGRDVTVSGGLLRVPEGAIVLASPTAGQVSLTGDAAQPVSFDAVESWGNVLVSDAAAIDTSGNSSGNLTLRGENITLANGAIVFARPLGNGTGSELLIEANDTIRFQGVQRVGDKTQDNALLGGTIGEATGSNIMLRSRELRMDDGAVISSITFSGSQGGNITIDVSEQVQLDGNGEAAIRCCTRVLADSRGTGNAGNILIETPLLQLTDGAQFASRAFQSGNGGQILVRADDVVLHGAIPITTVASVPVTNFFGARFPSGLFTVSRAGAAGDSGSIQIDSDRVLVDDLAEIQVTTFGSGRGGNLTLNATESIALRSQAGVNLTEPETTTIVGDQSFVQRDPSLSAFSELTLISAGATSTGDGGNLSVNTGQLTLVNGNILVGTIGSGDAGQLQVTASEGIDLDGSTIFSGSFGVGDSGNLQLAAPSLELTNGSLLSAATALDGTGAAGSVEIDVTDRVGLLQDSQIAATTELGDGGNVVLSAGLLELRDRSLLTAASRSQSLDDPGNGGNLTLDSEVVVLFDRSQISANAFTGNGGNIEIVTQGLYQAPSSQITASSAVGLAGVVEVSTPEIDSAAGLVQLSEEVVSADTLAIDRCRSAGSSFVISSRGGFPINPFEYTDLLLPTAQQPVPLGGPVAARSADSVPTATVEEARDWSIVDGRLTLTAAQPIASALPHCVAPQTDTPDLFEESNAGGA